MFVREYSFKNMNKTKKRRNHPRKWAPYAVFSIASLLFIWATFSNWGAVDDASDCPPLYGTCASFCLSGSREKVLLSLRREIESFLSIGTRVGGSNSSSYREAMSFIAERMQCSKHWSHSIESFPKVKTPVGRLTFNNLVAQLSGNEKRGHLVLAAHWDSKLMKDPSGRPFVGAIDSAVPVIQLLFIMRMLSLAVDAGSEMPRITVVFFDGEEAFVEWRGDDNTYGARLQAAKWERSQFLASISTFLLLDLVGSGDVLFHNFFERETGPQYAKLRNIDLDFSADPMWRAKRRSVPYFSYEPKGITAPIEDDHVPFLKRGVPVLHLISAPFPRVWHTVDDDASHLDYGSIYEIAHIVTRFAKEFSKLEVSSQQPG